jgi:hypothetical protein
LFTGAAGATLGAIDRARFTFAAGALFTFAAREVFGIPGGLLFAAARGLLGAAEVVFGAAAGVLFGIPGGRFFATAIRGGVNDCNREEVAGVRMGAYHRQLLCAKSLVRERWTQGARQRNRCGARETAMQRIPRTK